MSAEGFADFTEGLEEASASLGGFQAALEDAGDAVDDFEHGDGLEGEGGQGMAVCATL